MAFEPGSSPSRGVTLDQAPPQPPGGAKRASLMDTQGQGPPGLGAEAGNPQVIAVQGMATIEQGLQLVASVLPQLAPALMNLMSNLKQVVPQAMADQVAGVTGAGAGMPPGQGGGGPMAPSAPPMAAAGAPVPS